MRARSGFKLPDGRRRWRRRTGACRRPHARPRVCRGSGHPRARPSTRGQARALPGRPSSSISDGEVPANRPILALPRGTTSLTGNRSEMYPFRTPITLSSLHGVVEGDKKSCKSDRADARTRTGDPFITRERQVRDGRPLASSRGHVSAGNWTVLEGNEGTGVPARARADVPVLYPRPPRATVRSSSWRSCAHGRHGPTQSVGLIPEGTAVFWSVAVP